MLLELHAHSYYSHREKVKYDGTTSPASMMQAAAEKGVNVVALTDHNTAMGWKEARTAAKKLGIGFIPGEEIDSADGHVLALNITDVVRPGMPVEETVDRIHQQGGIAVASHPFDIHAVGTGKKSLACDALEAFNAINFDRLSNKKCFKFAKINRKPITAGSDAHTPYMIGRALTNVNAESVDSAIKEIINGRTSLVAKYQPISSIMRWSIDKLKMSETDILSYIDSNYSWPKNMLSRFMLATTKSSPGKIDVFYKSLAYVSLGSVITYSFFKNMKYVF